MKSPMKPASLLAALLALSSALAAAQLSGQTTPPEHGPEPARTAAAGATLPALFLSDIHFDPFLDPAKVDALNSAPVSDWARILAGQDRSAVTPAQQNAFHACTDGTDTSFALWQSTLGELRQTAASSRFIVISGDLLAHKFDCKYKALMPGASESSYLAFTVKTVRYVLTTLHAALPRVPIYTTLGNNDSGCTDYALDAQYDAFLADLAPLVAEVAQLTPADRASAERDFSALGSFNVPLVAVPHTRIISLDDLYLSAKYTTCSGARNADAGGRNAGPAARNAESSAAVMTWLKAQLESARAAHERVWFVSHIPPGVDLYATARKLTNICGGAKPTMFLGSEELAETLAAYSDVVRLALFGHTHDDEMRLLTPGNMQVQAADSRGAAERTIPETDRPAPVPISGVPLKIVASITPVHGNRPTFTLARVNPATATLIDYTVMIESDPAQPPITWSREYTYSTTYHEPAFDPASLTALIADFQGDPGDKWPASQAYIRSYFPAEATAATANSAVISTAWQPYACSLNHDSAKSFTDCACRK